jgi:hypothetical protein
MRIIEDLFMSFRRWKIWIAVLAVSGSAGLAGLAVAQESAAWQPPANLSNSGAASNPAIAATPDGVLHAIWWDAALGTLYARTTSATDSTWTAPERLPQIVGRRVVDAQTGTEDILAPRDMRLTADASGNVYAFWTSSTDELLSMVNRGTWSDPVTVASRAVQFAASPGAGDQLHLAYLRPIDADETPAGLYYRLASGGTWGPARRIDSSAYYRTLKPEQASLSVAGDGAGRVQVTWDQPASDQSQIARSTDQGATWSAPQPVSTAASGQARQARIAALPNGEFLLLWQNSAAPGCGFTHSRSSDGGETWTAPELVLSTLMRCDADWSFATDAAGRLWLLGRPKGAATTVIMAAVWDGVRWSEPRDVTFSFFDDRTKLSTNLSCVDLAVVGSTAALIGCDARNDVWAARNATNLDQLLPSLTVVWSQPQALTAQSGIVPPEALPDLAADAAGQVYAVWNQLAAVSSDSELYAAAWREGRWSSAARITTTESDAGLTAARQPSFSADNRERVHLVWSGGTAGEIYYSWAYARDLGTSQRWADSVRLSPAAELGRWPDLVADPRSTNVFVIYTLPFNEQRGVYLSASSDSGQTWQTPVEIFDAAAAGWESVDRARLALDPQHNLLHAVWQRRALPDQNQPEEISYAVSHDNGQTWSTPLKVAAGAVAWPQVIVPQAGQVYLAWCQSDAGATSVRGQISPDGGQRWSAPAVISQLDRATCPVGLATDNLGQMQIASTAANSGGESILLTAAWNGQSWSRSETLALGQSASDDNAAVIALVPLANRLSALIKLWSSATQSRSGFQIVATDREIPAVGVLQPAPTFTPMPTATPQPTSTPTPTETPLPAPNDRAMRPPSSSGGPPPLLLGGALAAIIVVIVVARVIWTKRR